MLITLNNFIFRERVSNIRNLIEKNAQLKASYKKKKALFLEKLAGSSSTPASEQQNPNNSFNSIESQLELVKETKFKEFETRWTKLNSMLNESVWDEKNKQSIEYLLSGETNQLELNGNDFIEAIKSNSQDENALKNFDENVLKLVYENISKIDAIRNVNTL
jgi:hypothetical protein